MNAFSIRDIENLCGIRAHTLRIWEQRYRLVRPRRKSGNHRTYDRGELKYLLRISFLYHRGHKISQLARLDEKELGQMILKYAEPGSTHEIFIDHLLEASLEFDQEAFDRVLHNIILQMGFEKAVTHLCFHLATNLLRSEPDHCLRRLSDAFPDKHLVLSGCGADSLRGHYPRLLRGLAEMEAFAKGQ